MLRVKKALTILLLLCISFTLFGEESPSWHSYKEPTNESWHILKAFFAAMVIAEDVYDTKTEAPFRLKSGEVRPLKLKGDVPQNMYAITSLSASVPNGDEVVRDLNGYFSYSLSDNSLRADLTGFFPQLDDKLHSVKITSVKDEDNTVYILNVDGTPYKMDKNSAYKMMLGGFEIALEYVFH